MSEQTFTPEITVDQAFKMHAGARRVFARFHLGGCSNCAISESHTIGAVSEDYGDVASRETPSEARPLDTCRLRQAGRPPGSSYVATRCAVTCTPERWSSPAPGAGTESGL